MNRRGVRGRQRGVKLFRTEWAERSDAQLLRAAPVNFDDGTGFYAGEVALGAALYGCDKTPETYDGGPVPPKYSTAVAAVPAPGSGLPSDPSAKPVIKRFKAMPEAERTEWLGECFAAVRDCNAERIRPSEAPGQAHPRGPAHLPPPGAEGPGGAGGREVRTVSSPAWPHGRAP